MTSPSSSPIYMTSATVQSRVILVVEDRSRKVAIRAGVTSADSGSYSVSLPSSLSTWSRLSINGGFLI